MGFHCSCIRTKASAEKPITRRYLLRVLRVTTNGDGSTSSGARVDRVDVAERIDDDFVVCESDVRARLESQGVARLRSRVERVNRPEESGRGSSE